MQWIRDGRIVLPRFQRNFVWKEENIRQLLCTVARNWPAGALLLATEMPGFEPLPLQRMGEVGDDIKFWVLDGQQRLTSLALVYRGLYQSNPKVNTSRVVSLDLEMVKSAGIVNPEHFDFESQTKWSGKYPTTKSQADARRVNLRDLIQFEVPDYNFWSSWLNAISDEDERAEYSRIRQENLNGLFSYNFPVLQIDSGTNWEEIVWIFTHINRQGKSLVPWDLVHARTWLPAGEGESVGFSIADAWKEWEWRIGLPQRSKRKRYDPYYKVSADDVLRLMKVCADEAEPPADESARGITVGKIVEAQPSALRKGFEGQLDVLSSTVAFLRENAGLVPVNFRPELSIPIAFAARFHKPTLTQKETQDKVLRWYWSRLFSQRYDFGSTNGLLMEDCQQLLSWLKGENDGIDGVSDFWEFDHPRVGLFTPEKAFRSLRAGNKSLAYGVLALQVAAGAMDWSSGNVIRGIAELKLQVHHVFPKGGNTVGVEAEAPPDDEAIEGMISDEGFEGDDPEELIADADADDSAEDDGDDVTQGGAAVAMTSSKDAVFNFAVLEQPTNARISKHPPDHIVMLESTTKVPAPTRTYIESSLIDVNSLGDWSRFQESRVKLLTAELEKRLPRG